ncbi:MAG: UDP-N-acetylmuramoyl-L-alanine--D-glutamate ligase [Eubacteriales bacterium]|nr:UDP-N-acetylmuramoyl-L-alanine--D-glutamate ligase [Eubacteriales bacterium]
MESKKNLSRKALIVGMAKSGIGAAKLLCRVGWEVVVNDKKSEIEGLKEALEGAAVTWRLGEDPVGLFDGVSLIVISPIIPMTVPFVMEAKRRGIEVISEIELGYRYSHAEFVCITGTNGKTTCTALTGEMFKAGGRHTFVLGNIGVAITEHALDTREGDVVVAETAGLQLEGNVHFHARAAGVCNITEDHLDHFGTMENYIAAKSKIFDHQTAEDIAVLNYDDAIVRDMARLTPAKAFYFSRKEAVPRGCYLSGDTVIYRDEAGESPLIRADEIRIPGGHNLENAMLCSLLALGMGISADAVRETLKSFPGVEHRIEFVREFEGVRYINDSKGTNPDSTIKAIQAMTRPTVLILGGYDKHSDFHELFEHFHGSTLKAIVVLGATKQKILDTARDTGFLGYCHATGTFADAVSCARVLAQPGDAVLLSPACASWDMFDNFEQRGRVFKEIVNQFK